jgi:hypothetical protein
MESEAIEAGVAELDALSIIGLQDVAKTRRNIAFLFLRSGVGIT